jgi:thiamine biosynthesis lipoprotein
MPATYSLRALGTTAVAAVTEASALPEARAIMVSDLRALDLACSRFRSDSELHALNQAAGTPVQVSELLWDSLVAALEAARMTGGLVDPTLGRAMRLAGYDRTFSRLAFRDGCLVPASFAPGGRWREIELEPKRRAVCVPAGVELDLGASAKAAAADRIAARIAEATGSGALVSLGGDVSVAGLPPDRGWVIGVDDDHSTSPELVRTTVVILHGGLASSGTAVRRWRTSAGELHHVLDPRTGRPVRAPWTTVTVAAATCLDANVASTAALVLGGEAPGWLSERKLPARLARPDGSVLCVAGWPADLVAA